MHLTDQGKKYLKEAANWASFISIIGFIGIGLLIIMSFTVESILSALPAESLGGLPPRFFSFFYLIIGGIYFIPVFYLFQFANKTKEALDKDDISTLTFGLKKLKSHYKFIGILVIVSIVFYIALIMIGAFGALAMS